MVLTHMVGKIGIFSQRFRVYNADEFYAVIFSIR